MHSINTFGSLCLKILNYITLNTLNYIRLIQKLLGFTKDIFKTVCGHN